MQIKEQHINKILVWLMIVSAVVRGVLAAWLEFGNDEVYYWTYALYPDWSHFDHPPMVGWMIQLFSLNLLFDSEFFIRLASVVIMTANTYIIYHIGKDLKDAQTGLYAALLYTASIYAFVITGVFIMPDTPLMLFWLLAFWMAVKYFKSALRQAQRPLHLLLFGLFAGLAMLSKYSGVFLWVGMGLYILIFNRKPLKTWAFYCALLISIISVLPILKWNLQYNFISLNFHSGRVGGGTINFSTFGTELAGEFFYNNPVIFVLAIIAIIWAFKGKIKMENSAQRLVLCTALPLMLVFLLFSLTRPTLPHWNAPAYTLIILLISCILSQKNPSIRGRFKLPKSITAAMCVLLVTVVIGVAEIETGFIPLDKHTEPEMLGRDDFTIDMYGWRQLGEKFADFRAQKIAEGLMNEEDGIVANQWFPLANLDYYVARPLRMRVMGLGWPEQLHKYLWINDERGGFQLGENFWFLSDSRYPKDPKTTYQWFFKEIELVDTIQIERCGQPVKNFFVYTCKDLCAQPPTLQQLTAKSAEADTTSRP
jgi:hypothetical protein